MSEILRDATPKPELIRSLRATSDVSITVALEELFDNSFDAEATNISVTLSGRSLLVEDNGHGCSNITAMVTLGDRLETQSPKIGRFGIGLKEIAIRLGDETEIESRHNNVVYSARLDWASMVRNQNWTFRERSPIASRGPSFTKIECPRLVPDLRAPNKSAIERLGHLYTPALVSGKTILYNGEPLVPSHLPKLREAIIHSGQYEGRPWNLKAGLLIEPSRAWRGGYTIAFRDRFIVSGCSYGTMEYSSRNFFGYVELFETGESQWLFDRKKHGLVGAEEFLESLFPFVEPLLKKAQTQGRDIRFEQQGRVISDRLSAMIQEKYAARERRDKGSSHRTAEDQKSGVKRDWPEKHDPEHPGSIPTNSRKRGMKIIVEWSDFLDKRIGCVSVDRHKCTVTLNKAHELFLKDPSDDLIALAAISLFVLYDRTHGDHGQELLDFGDYNGQILDSVSGVSGELLQSYMTFGKAGEGEEGLEGR